jgi:hypothetical protein
VIARAAVPDAVAARLAQALAAALATRDIDAVVRLLAADVRFSMPPLPAVWRGHEKAVTFLTRAVFRLVPEALFIPVGANRQPALAVYARDPASGAWRANGLLVITVAAPPGGGDIQEGIGIPQGSGTPEGSRTREDSGTPEGSGTPVDRDIPAKGACPEDGKITAVTRFDASRLRAFGLPGILKE